MIEDDDMQTISEDESAIKQDDDMQTRSEDETQLLSKLNES